MSSSKVSSLSSSVKQQYNPVPNKIPFPNSKQCKALEDEDLQLEIQEITKKMITNHEENVYDMSTKSNILLIFRRYVKYQGCGFCNRRMNQMMEFYRTLRQYNIVPVIVYPEDVEEGERFFSNFNTPEIQNITRINDPDQEYASQFNVFYDSPPNLTLLSYLIPHLAKVHLEGFEQGFRSLNAYFNNSFLIKPCMFLIRNGSVAKSWRHNYADYCPNIIKDLILHMDKTIASPISHMIIDRLIANDNEEEEIIEIHESINDPLTTVSKTTISQLSNFLNNCEPLLKSVPMYKMIRGTCELQALTFEMKKSMEEDILRMCKGKKRNIPKSNLCFSEIEFYQNVDPKTIDVNMVLQVDHFRKYFKINSSKEYNSENIIFWEDVNLKYKPLVSNFGNFNKAKVLAETIGNCFLFDDSSIMYVNTRDKLRQDVKLNISQIFSKEIKREEFEQQAPLLFDQVLNEMTSSVLQDMFIRFSVSDLFNEMLLSRSK